MFAKIHSVQIVGLRPDIIDVEVDIGKGLHSFAVVGLPDKAVEEAKDRINAAIKNSGFKAPARGNKKVIISLAPADIKKEGTHFDLPIALGFLLANGDIKFDPTGKIFIGELGLSGDLRPGKGILLLVKKAKEAGFTEIFVPKANSKEAALIRGISVYGVDHLKTLVSHLSGPPIRETSSRVEKINLTAEPVTVVEPTEIFTLIDFADIKSQSTTKRGLEIAAAGGHNVSMFGPPGTGKTMLAKAFAGILPPLSFEEILEVTGIHSAAGVLEEELITAPPFRAPHHTASYVSLVGGGTWPKPGEITLAHRGVLFLDEFPEFEKRVIEALRQPLEDRVITVARAKHTTRFPAQVILIAAMNPCPCGNRGTKNKECVCSQLDIMRYDRKLSGPIMDRIDIWLQVPPVDYIKLSDNASEETSHKIKTRVLSARQKQIKRFAGTNLKSNSEMNVKDLKKFAPLGENETKLLNNSAARLDLSARAYHRVIKLARTIADLASAENIEESHLLEALQYRPKSLN
ncbi:MAG: YifB family Mg chelatase-like AAA ATPase [Candidatus Vogelbacteria bacterium]|nr:YifB family Mg chelatase-like AAA ATPase [Candidatus Vogelbacteria bacterium]